MGRGHVIIEGQLSHTANLSSFASTINAADTPHKGQVKPGLMLEVFCKIDKKSAKTALDALGKVKGVDVKGSITNLNLGTLGVRLSGKDKVSVTDILAALKTAGVQPRIVTTPEKPKAAEAK